MDVIISGSGKDRDDELDDILDTDCCCSWCC